METNQTTADHSADKVRIRKSCAKYGNGSQITIDVPEPATFLGVAQSGEIGLMFAYKDSGVVLFSKRYVALGAGDEVPDGAQFVGSGVMQEQTMGTHLRSIAYYLFELVDQK